jgi:hypothetical protein
MTKGEIWVTELPAKGGHVQRGIRPALILADATKSIALPGSNRAIFGVKELRLML